MGSSWQHWLERLRTPVPKDPGGRLLVLSAHPDDDVIAIGGWLAGQTTRDVTFVTATDGEGSHPGSLRITREELRQRRPAELVNALRVLGFDEPRVHRLGLTDSGLATQIDELERALGDFVATADLVLAPYESDGHSDHDALGEVALDLCGSHTLLWRFPIWTWAWTAPEQQEWLRQVRRLTVTAEQRQRKRQALAAFETQIDPIGPDSSGDAVIEPALHKHARYAPEAVIV